MAIVENNNEARALLRFVHRHNQRKATLVPEDLKPKLPLRRVREDPAFQDKLPGHPLVLAAEARSPLEQIQRAVRAEFHVDRPPELPLRSERVDPHRLTPPVEANRLDPAPRPIEDKEVAVVVARQRAR